MEGANPPICAATSYPTFGCAEIGTPACSRDYQCAGTEGIPMNGLIYLIGLIVVIMAILSFLGLR